MGLPERASSGFVVLPGVPNMPGLTVDEGVTPFPDTTTDFVKVLRARGADIRYSLPREERRYVGHKAFELWLPILECTRDFFIAMGAGLLIESIKDYLAPRSAEPRQAVVEPPGEQSPGPAATAPAILHVEFHVSTPEGRRESFVANGATPDVFRALEEFEQHVRGDEGA